MDTTAGRGPVRVGERALAPDLARGFMLLGIVLANTPLLLYGDDSGAPPAPADVVAQSVIMTLIDRKAYPMFAFLFGYGMVQLYQRQLDAGSPAVGARRLLQRRNLCLIGFGLVHAALLWDGDILGSYGLLGLIVVAVFLGRRDRTLLRAAAVLAVGHVVVLAAAVVVDLVSDGEYGITPAIPYVTDYSGTEQTSYPHSVLARSTDWARGLLVYGLTPLVIAAVVLLGCWAARHRILERPLDHLPLLRRAAVAGLAVGWAGGAGYALAHFQVIQVPYAYAWLYEATQATGALGGLGYVAVFALVAARYQLRERIPGPVAVAVIALGQRSLSGYLAQSVINAPVFAAWGFGIGAWMTSAPTALFAVGVWLITVLLAEVLRQRTVRGPAETLLRRLAYRSPSRTEVREPR
ncbi:DUF418 domain-containing protein [Microlunatus parietis]|uniref:Putative membrane protein YeiB n=1 Tax=Microlunatus parietis TaxID=682979 RepID=A0A7Y9I724_9ACTN|nr:DUF418 domain-containing protein [Microlunatus parietis]NYE71435.1 putative membrane protein YeiB [Microlunatus parietis]